MDINTPYTALDTAVKGVRKTREKKDCVARQNCLKSFCSSVHRRNIMQIFPLSV